MTVQIIPGESPVEDITPDAFFEASQPYAVAVIDGNRFVVESYEIEENAHGATNTGHIVLPIAGNPDFTILLFRNEQNPAPVSVELYSGFPTNLRPGMLDISQLTKIFIGTVDQYAGQIDPHTGSVTFQLRSLGAPLVDNKITALAVNMTTVQFVKAACAYYGIQCIADVIGSPLTLQEVIGQMNVGGSNFASSVYGMHIWDLILKCSEFDDVDVWEDSRTGVIHYEPPSTIQRNTAKYTVGNNVESLSMVHSPQFSKNIQVEVRTYQHRTRVSYAVKVETDPLGGVKITSSMKTVTSSPVFGTPNLVTTRVSPTGAVTTTNTTSTGGSFTGSAAQGTEPTKERYIIYVRNLSPAAANTYARAKWRQISMHEYSITLSEAVTIKSLTQIVMTTLLQVDKAPYTMFNDTYWPRRITTSMNVHEGWKRTFEAVNHTLPQGAV